MLRRFACLSSLLSLSVLSLVMLSPATSRAFNAGAPGFSGKSSGLNCSGCHSGTAAPTVALTGPTSLTAGMVGEYTLTITASGAGAKTGALDVAASTADAVLAAEGADEQVTQGEVVQTAATPLTGGAITYTFKVTAPATSGSFTLYASGFTGDGVDAASAGDAAATTMLAVNVTGGSAGAGSGTGGGNGNGTGGGNGNGANNGSGMTGSDGGANWTGCSMGGGHGDGGGMATALVLLAALARAVRPRRRHPRVRV